MSGKRRRVGITGRLGGHAGPGVGLVALRETVTRHPLPDPPSRWRWIGMVTELQTIVPVDFVSGHAELVGSVRYSARVEFYLERDPGAGRARAPRRRIKR